MVMGTAGYMSPEQVRAQRADARSDIFSLGAIPYEMLSGRRAFKRESSVETMNAILKEDPPELDVTTGRVPPGLARVVEHCVEKEPEQRFQSARDLAFALESVASPSTPDAGASIELHKRRSPSWLVAAALTVALAAVAWLGFLAGTRRAQFSPPSYLQLTLEPGYAGPARFSRDGSAVVYSAAWNGGPLQLHFRRTSGTQSRALGVDADVLGIADDGDMAVILKHRFMASWLAKGTLARLPFEGGTPRPVLEDVYAADIARERASDDIPGRKGRSLPAAPRAL